MKENNIQLVFFTEGFPYGNIEAFIETEIIFLAEYFSCISILPFKTRPSEKLRSVPKNVEYLPPLFSFNKMKLIFKGIFNFSPIFFVFPEFFKKRVYRRTRWIKKWMEASLYIRAMLNHKVLKPFLNQTNKLQIFYFYWGTGAGFLLPFLPQKSNVTKIVRFHNSDLYEDLGSGYIPYRDKQLKKTDAAVFISDHGLKYLTNKYPTIHFKKKIHRLGVFDRGISKRSEDGIFRIVSCSHLVSFKRIPLIVEALKKLEIDVEWTHIGGGPEEAKVNSMIHYLPDNIRAELMGYIKNEEVLAFYSSNPVDLFINVSEREGVPVSIMEALSAGIPVFATDVCGVNEIVDDTVGRLLPASIESDKLASELKKFYNIPLSTKISLGKNAKERWKRMCRAEEVYIRFGKFLRSLVQDEA